LFSPIYIHMGNYLASLYAQSIQQPTVGRRVEPLGIHSVGKNYLLKVHSPQKRINNDFMKNINLILYYCLFSLISLQAQPDIQWQKNYGSPGNDSFFRGIPLPDGGYLLGGATDSTGGDVSGWNGNADFWIVRTDASGNMLWEKTYGGTEEDAFMDFTATQDGGFLLCGYTYSNDGDVTLNRGFNDGWIIKINSTGDLIWQQTYGGISADAFIAVIGEDNGDFLIAGQSSSVDGDIAGSIGGGDIWVLRIDSTGQIKSSSNYGGTNSDFPRDIIRTSDGGHLIIGGSFSNDIHISGNHGSIDVCLIKLNAQDSMEWIEVYGGPDMDIGYYGIVNSAGEYIISCSSLASGGQVSQHHGNNEDDAWIINVSPGGILQWEKSIGGSYHDDLGMPLELPGGGYIFAGSTESNDGDVTINQGGYDLWLVCTDDTGSIVWQKTYGGSYDDGGRILFTTDNSLVILGATGSNDGDIDFTVNGWYDAWLVKFDDISSGSIL